MARRKFNRPKRTLADTGDRASLLERSDLSRQRLAASELASSAQAWKLWTVCIDQTLGYCREADMAYASALATKAGVDRTDAGRLLHRFAGLRILVWRPTGERGSQKWSELGLPNVQATARMKPEPRAGHSPHDGPTCRSQPALQSNESLSVELNSHNSTLDTGEQHQQSPLSTAPEGSSESWEAERPASPEARPEPGWVEAIEAALDAPAPPESPAVAKTLARFGEAEPAATSDLDVNLGRRR
jgi:hypothetical protein